MSIAAVIGHAHAKRILTRALAGPRRAHAYLFDGPRGVGKMTLAREFAKALLCAGGGPDACDRCPSCGQMARGQHPYFLAFARAPGDKSISIEALRDEAQLDKKIALKPCGSPYKIFAFDDAETLSLDAASWLLKVLEEPPPQTLFLLVASVRRQLPSTILSRCQRVRCGRLAGEETRRVLVERAGVPEPEARGLTRLAPGAPGQILALRDAGAVPLFDRVREIFGHLARGAYGERLDAWAQEFELKKADSAEARRRAALLLEAAAEDVASALRGENADPALRGWLDRVGLARAVDALDRLLRAQSEIGRNANPMIVVEAAFGALAADAG
jgi:DNA polymerase-3 subunit delta'